ncbi:hypothetical protein BDV95DRAFT_608462 [Massariosphaeria phaeospora]|uniref:Uncharacterized protein n=1 Tax=Massariosphaeria phaeospora TaxID=100035 RepID=A0A7C8M744_9PLEO|nr:hypothetical protein BDV95DRAFT_608462 [Massariosphaeria phaeospora]
MRIFVVLAPLLVAPLCSAGEVADDVCAIVQWEGGQIFRYQDFGECHSLKSERDGNPLLEVDRYNDCNCTYFEDERCENEQKLDDIFQVAISSAPVIHTNSASLQIWSIKCKWD